jgi:hypothetical protein
MRAATLLAGCALALVAAPQAAATHHRIYYSYRDSGCASAVDPVTVIFLGTHATAARVSNHLVYHHWGSNEEGGTQWVRSNGCQGMGAERASRGSDADDRYHARLWDSRERDHDGNRYVAATPHYEFKTKCAGVGHAVSGYAQKSDGRGAYSGFNRGRRRMGELFKYGAHHHHTTVVDWGNSDVFRQPCTNEWAGSNGYVTIVHMGHIR